MFENTGHPIKVWLNDMDSLEDKCLEQAYHLSQLPFVHKWVCLMPDTHTGKGMPIGGVFAAKDVVIPNAVGTDIGCGMVFIKSRSRAGHSMPLKITAFGTGRIRS